MTSVCTSQLARERVLRRTACCRHVSAKKQRLNELSVDDLTEQRTIFGPSFVAVLEIVAGVILQLLLSSV